MLRLPIASVTRTKGSRVEEGEASSAKTQPFRGEIGCVCWSMVDDGHLQRMKPKRNFDGKSKVSPRHLFCFIDFFPAFFLTHFLLGGRKHGSESRLAFLMFIIFLGELIGRPCFGTGLGTAG